jgi:hypothetical protein
LGLRNLARCPVELNLMPKSSLKRQEFDQKKPYLVAAAFCLILIVWAAAWFYNRVAGEKEKALEKLKAQLGPLASHEQQLRDATSAMKRVQYETDEYTDWLEDRWYWANVLSALRDSLVAAEEKKEKDFSPAKVGVWVEKLVPVMPAGYLTAGTAELPAALKPPGDAPPPVRPPRGRGRAAAGGPDRRQ